MQYIKVVLVLTILVYINNPKQFKLVFSDQKRRGVSIFITTLQKTSLLVGISEIIGVSAFSLRRD